jgi:hypothetical protein
MAIQNENRAEARRLSFRNLPDAIVIPQRESPGNSPIAWANPMRTASGQRIWRMDRGLWITRSLSKSRTPFPSKNAARVVGADRNP